MIRNMTSEAFSNLRLFTCNSHPELAQEIAEHMGIELGKSTVTRFSDGETSVSIWESVRGRTRRRSSHGAGQTSDFAHPEAQCVNAPSP